MTDEFAQRLAALRREKGYSQEALGSELGLSRQAISKWERAESQPDTANLIALADLYGLTLDELVRNPRPASDPEADRSEGDTPSPVSIMEVEETATAKIEPPFTAGPRGEAPAVETRSSDEASLTFVEAYEAGMIDTSSSAQSAALGEEAAVPSSTIDEVPRPETDAAPQPMPNTSPQPIGAPASQPTAQMPQDKFHNPLLMFPYPVVVVIIYLAIGFLFGWWHPGWVLFLTIPFYYWGAAVVGHDPNFRADHTTRPFE